jgi:hypothetical protein
MTRVLYPYTNLTQNIKMGFAESDTLSSHLGDEVNNLDKDVETRGTMDALNVYTKIQYQNRTRCHLTTLAMN